MKTSTIHVTVNDDTLSANPVYFREYVLRGCKAPCTVYEVDECVVGIDLDRVYVAEIEMFLKAHNSVTEYRVIKA